jgi:hypothetical protein
MNKKMCNMFRKDLELKSVYEVKEYSHSAKSHLRRECFLEAKCVLPIVRRGLISADVPANTRHETRTVPTARLPPGERKRKGEEGDSVAVYIALVS